MLAEDVEEPEHEHDAREPDQNPPDGPAEAAAGELQVPVEVDLVRDVHVQARSNVQGAVLLDM